MFNWFKKEKEKPKLCSMCNKYQPIQSDMGDEFCFTCLVIRFKQVMNNKSFERKPQ